VWETGEGKLIRTLKGHGHWVNTLALSSEYALRTGAFNHRGEAPAEPEAAKTAALERYTAACGGLP
jgi:ribosome assembly protein 4